MQKPARKSIVSKDNQPRAASRRLEASDPARIHAGRTLPHKLGNLFARGLATVALVLVGSWTLTPLLAIGRVTSYLQSHRRLVPTKSERLAVGDR
jgi:hypothetical protein